ncbi:hypothetical protein DPMN_042876 [Dreissena polymorpha]|uniref:Uncharacterized protein n=1 Tax=Dreissena polymorpha TaxID=45954 RepID=A0A9D4HXF1_DREPO|nr:hypothetical protein DPMN_042876 [Dreissena polymorpha]
MIAGGCGFEFQTGSPLFNTQKWHPTWGRCACSSPKNLPVCLSGSLIHCFL